jgi:hypothetical protein
MPKLAAVMEQAAGAQIVPCARIPAISAATRPGPSSLWWLISDDRLVGLPQTLSRSQIIPNETFEIEDDSLNVNANALMESRAQAWHNMLWLSNHSILEILHFLTSA